MKKENTFPIARFIRNLVLAHRFGRVSWTEQNSSSTISHRPDEQSELWMCRRTRNP